MSSVLSGQSAFRGDIGTMLNHLCKCAHQPSDVRNWALQEHQTKYARPSARSVIPMPFIAPLPMLPQASSSHQPPQNTPALFLQQFPQTPLHPQPGLTPQLPPFDINNQSPALVVDAPFPTLPHTNALGFYPQLSPNISPSHTPSRPPSSMSSYPQGHSASRPQSQLSSNFDQHKFNVQIGRMTIAAGLPLSWTDNPEARSVFHIFFPWAQLPSQKTLSRSILPALQTSLRAQSQKETKGTKCTLQCDGWTGINMHHLIAFMITIWPKVCIFMVFIFCHVSLLDRSIAFGCMMHMAKQRLQRIFWIFCSL